MNWEQIKYIFQIPISWYKKIHERVFNAYGTNFIKIKEGYYGGMEIGLDTDELDKYLEDNGSVKSVDDVEPDDDGNIELNAVTTDTVQTITANKTFQDASIGFSHDVQGSATNVGDVSGGVSSGVNQVTVEAVNGNNDSGITLSVDGNGVTSQLLNNEPARLYSQGDDNQIASRGYARLNFARASHTHGNISNDGKITQAPGTSTPDYYIAADSNGNLYRELLSNVTGDYITSSQLDTILLDYVTNTSLSTTLLDYVTNTSLVTTLLSYATQSWVQSQGYLTDADLSDYVTNTSLTTTLADYVTNTSLTTTLSNYATQNDIADFVTMTEVQAELLDYVKSVDGHTPDVLTGAVSFGLTANKWLKSDANGHIVTTNDSPYVPSTSSSGYLYNNSGTIQYKTFTASKWVKTDSSGLLTTTNDEPITINSQSSGYLYNNAGTLQYKDDEYVTLATQQIITGAKTFNGTGDMILMTGGGTIGMIGGTNHHVRMSSDGLQMVQGLSVTLDLGTTTTASGNMPHIDFLNGGYSGSIYRGSGSDGISSNLHIGDEQGIEIHAPANQATLTNHPTETSTSSKAIATVGYCQSHFGSGGGTVTSVDHVSPDAQGNVQLNAIRTINGHNGDSVGNFAGVVTSVNGETPNDGAVTLSVVETVNSTSPDANGNVDVGTVKEVDGHSPNAQGAVSFGLTASKWVKTDSSGHLTTTNDTPVSIPSNKTGQTTNITLVTGVTWNGTQLVVARTQLNFTNGVLTGTTSQSNTTIATVAYT